MNAAQIGTDSNGTWTAEQFVIDMGYTHRDVQTIASVGSLDAAEEAAELTADQRAAVVAYCVAQQPAVTITADDENNAEAFWVAFGKAFPEIANRVRRGQATVDAATWKAIQQIDGFSDGPDYANNALVVVQLQQPATIRRNADGQQSLADLRRELADSKHMVYQQGGNWIAQQWSEAHGAFIETPMHPSCGEREAIQKCLFGNYETPDEAALRAKR